MSLRPPSTSPSPSPGPNENGRINSRQSLGPAPTSARGTPGLGPSSPRPGARPTSELYGQNSAMFQTPESEALDQWFENLQSYEATLEEMAAASLDVNFKEELSAIEQWFKVLSEAERTAALYSLLQHSTQVQIRFFITVLQQMARSDPMTALLSPAMGGSMQSQMESKLASLKSAGAGGPLKSGLPASPTTRAFNRQSMGPLESPSFLSPDSAALGSGTKEDAAATLAQQRNKLKATNAAHRISAPVLASDVRAAWGPSGGGLSQVAEANSPNPDGTTSRPKSSDFSGSPRQSPAALGADGSQTVSADNSWASMVNTPLIPMFQKDASRVNRAATLEQANNRSDWGKGVNAAPGVPRMADPPVGKRRGPGPSGGDYDDNGPFGNSNRNRNNGSAWSGTGGRGGGGQGGVGGGRFNAGGSPEEAAAALQQMQALMAAGAMGSPNGLNMGMFGGMNPMASPLNMNMLLSPEARLLATQMAMAGGLGHPGFLGMPPNSAASSRRSGPPSGRSTTGIRSPGTSTGGATPRGEEDVDPALLNDIPGWLRSLRLHKYTPNFEGMKWQDMVILDEGALEAKGVAALGARRKMLKTFELVRKKMGIEGGPPSLPPSATI